MSIFTNLGWACQTIEHDYGEDLFVQPMFDESVDPFRIWVQVKGTNDAETLRNSAGQLAWRVSHGHILRWIRSLETNVVVLWDIKTNRGYWTLPRTEFNEWECYQSKQNQATLLFQDENLFDLGSANKLIWDSRIEHYDSLIALARTTESRVMKDRRDDSSAHPHYRSPVASLAFDLLRLIGFIGRNGVSRQLRKSIECLARRWVRENPKCSLRDARGSSLLLVICELLNKKCLGLSIPEDLLLEVAPIAALAILAIEAD